MKNLDLSLRVKRKQSPAHIRENRRCYGHNNIKMPPAEVERRDTFGH